MTRAHRPGTAARAAIGSLLVGVALVGCADAAVAPSGPVPEPSPAPTAFETVIIRIELLPASPELAPIPRREVVPVGSEVEIIAPAGLEGQMHVRGFEVVSTSTAGEPGQLRFRADEAGTFLVEAELTGQTLVVLEVLPGQAT
jgi:hypothetical protein